MSLNDRCAVCGKGEDAATEKGELVWDEELEDHYHWRCLP